MGKKHESARLLVEEETIGGLPFNKDVIGFSMRKKYDMSLQEFSKCHFI